MRKTTVLLCACMLLLPLRVAAEDFFVTSRVHVTRSSGGMSYSVKADIPVQGNAKAMAAIKKWICDCVCEYDNDPDAPQALDADGFKKLLEDCCRQYFSNNSGGCQEEMEIYRSYEDEDVVTYEMSSSTRDKADGDSFRDEDCISVSKADGHRIQANEIFKCGDDKIRQLMWQWHGDLPVEGLRPEELVIGDVAFTDGWIVVIGPANGYTGAAYRIRYQAAEPFLRKSKDGDYY